jgi:hypothetical protein
MHKTEKRLQDLRRQQKDVGDEIYRLTQECKHNWKLLGQSEYNGKMKVHDECKKCGLTQVRTFKKPVCRNCGQTMELATGKWANNANRKAGQNPTDRREKWQYKCLNCRHREMFAFFTGRQW